MASSGKVSAMNLTPADRYRLVLTTCPDADSARRIGDALVAEALAACVNVIPGLVSTYIWKGDTVRDSELLLLIKTRADRLPALSERLLALHPYELPEIVTVSLAEGLEKYLQWIDHAVETKT